MVAPTLGENGSGVMSVCTKLSHLVLGFGSSFLLFCPLMSDDYKEVITWFQLITGSWQDFEFPD